MGEAAQSRDGAAGGGCDGIIVEFYPVLHPHQLDSVLHAAEIPGHLADGFVADQAIHRSDGGHVVFDVVGAGNQNVLGVQNFFAPAIDGPIFLPHAVGSLLPGEEMGLPHTCEGGGNGVIGVQNQQIPLLLEAEDVLLGLHIFLHVLVDIQMVGGQVGDHCPLGASLHVHQLEGAELHHGIVLLLHLPAKGQQGRADVASQPHGLPLGFQHFGNQGGGGGFSVGTGDGNNKAGSHLKEHLHLRGDLRPSLNQSLDGGISRVHAGGAEHHLRLHALQIIFSHL